MRPFRRSAAGKRSGRRVLAVIAVLFLASGITRLSDGTGLALAREIGAFVSAAYATSPAQGAEDTPGFEDLLAAVRAREAKVAEEERRLDERERALAAASEEIAAQLAALGAAEEELRGLLALADTAAEEDIARLTSVYEAMKSAEAAALFEKMDPAFAAGFLGRMRPDAAAEILAGLPPEKAYALSVVLAGRNAAAAAE